MINLKNFLEIDEEKNRYTLPVNFSQKILFTFLSNYFTKYKFTERLFVDNAKYHRLYWETILNYLKLNLNIEVKITEASFFGKFLYFSTKISSKKDVKDISVIQGYGAEIADFEISLSKGVGEFLERYFLRMPGQVDQKNIQTIKISDLRSRVKIGSDFHRYSYEQKKQFTNLGLKSKEVQVIKVEELISKTKTIYPIQQIFRYILDVKEKEGYVSQTTTSGGAGGFTLEQATLGAIYESVERDAFMCHYLTKSPLTKIKINKGEIHLYDKLEKFFKSLNFNLEIFETTTDLGIFSCICKLENIQTGGICISGGANLDPNKAIESALKEIVAAANPLQKNIFPDFPENPKEINRDLRLTLAASGKYKREFSFLTHGGEMSLQEVYEKNTHIVGDGELDFLLNKLKSAGNGYGHVYRFVVKNEILEKLNYFVVKVVMPKLYKLYLDEEFILQDSDRLSEFNLWKNKTSDFSLNAFPHPFP